MLFKNCHMGEFAVGISFFMAMIYRYPKGEFKKPGVI
jgi:hypothetical protein